jgi:hypothetical protein
MPASTPQAPVDAQEETKPVFTESVSDSTNGITPQEYTDHMTLSLTQLETVTLMLQILDQVDQNQSGGK